MELEIYDRKDYKKGDSIIVQGEEARNLYIIEKGLVEIWHLKDGVRKTITQLGPGRIFGEMAFVDSAPRTATATASEPTICIRVSGKKLTEELEHCPPFIRALMKVLVKNLRVTTK
ncbi:MAG: cyclic nucleotide-binding domain-containing protein [Alphaproteobacteria bacterium]|nr:cyclic nucleotide-binding domain-containing protein [Alphaproteobacteria bacterium]